MKQVFSILGTLTAITTGGAVLLWLARYYVAATAVGAFSVALWLLLVILLSIALGSWWTLAVEDRAASRIQAAINQNDNFDARKTASMATLVREGIRLGVSNVPRLTNELPALPLPGQTGDWIPALENMPFDAEFREELE